MLVNLESWESERGFPAFLINFPFPIGQCRGAVDRLVQPKEKKVIYEKTEYGEKYFYTKPGKADIMRITSDRSAG